jgi:hypothetical protein
MTNIGEMSYQSNILKPKSRDHTSRHAGLEIEHSDKSFAVQSDLQWFTMIYVIILNDLKNGCKK